MTSRLTGRIIAIVLTMRATAAGKLVDVLYKNNSRPYNMAI